MGQHRSSTMIGTSSLWWGSPTAVPLHCPGPPLSQGAAKPSEDTEADIARRAERGGTGGGEPASRSGPLDAVGWAVRWGALGERSCKGARVRRRPGPTATAIDHHLNR